MMSGIGGVTFVKLFAVGRNPIQAING